MTEREQEYADIHEFILKLATSVKAVNLDKFIKQINVAEQVSPLTDPELFEKAGTNLKRMKKLACSLRQFQLVTESLGSIK